MLARWIAMEPIVLEAGEKEGDTFVQSWPETQR